MFTADGRPGRNLREARSTSMAKWCRQRAVGGKRHFNIHGFMTIYCYPSAMGVCPLFKSPATRTISRPCR